MRTMLFIATLFGLVLMATGARAQAAPISLTLQKKHTESYVEAHSRQVWHSMLRFRTVRTVEQQQDSLDWYRERDRLSLFAPAQTQSASYGVALFGAITVLAAHAPRSLQVLFTGPVHLGPAIFDGGGLGAGVGGRFSL
jgi:hypothetical protein